jgi:hypothetical protein
MGSTVLRPNRAAQRAQADRRSSVEFEILIMQNSAIENDILCLECFESTLRGLADKKIPPVGDAPAGSGAT